ncbi:related to hexose transporter protein [Cephalotrichum gorgonifer]|uniref:Related to hexose transporter protein n=1 Tax=Cephalotrichum gorgonifer TaxID=2041049 RepID=A0AAE8STQ9_9PEZI|nr:related to hexose transporter protein [Cephalotrichum gorgonifer]
MVTHPDALPVPTAPLMEPTAADMERYSKRWWRHKNLRSLNAWMLIPLISIFAQGFDGSMMNGLQSVSHWRSYFGTPTGATLGIFNAAYPLGGIAGVFLIRIPADRWGRRVGIAVGASLCCLGAVLQGAAVNLPMFVISRVALGAGSVVVAGVGAPYITEIAHPAQRSTATALFLTFYALGSITAGWTTFGTFRINGEASWRIPSALQGLPSIIQLLLVWFVPESPRWLVSKGRADEALAMLARYHGEGDPNDAVVRFEYHEITTMLASEKEMARSSLWEFATTPGNRRRLAIMIWAAICSQMSGNAFVSYYLAPVLTSVGLTTDLQQTLINATSQMVSWFSALYFATLPEKLGRRTLFLGSLVSMWIVIIAITAGSAEFDKDNDNKAAGYAVVVFLYLFSPAYNLGFNGNLGLYIPEILPYHLRTLGLSVFYFVQFCFMILSNFAVPVGLENIQWRLYPIFVAWVMVEFAGVWFLFPETKGPSLEEIAWIFDGTPEDKLARDALDVEKASVAVTEKVAAGG